MELPLGGIIILLYLILLFLLWIWFIKPYMGSLSEKNRIAIQDEEILAYVGFKEEIYEYLYPSDLTNHKQVEKLFDLCGILQGHITALGWQYLFRSFGFQELLSIDKKSEWIWDETEGSEEWILTIVSYALHAGYNPIHDCSGKWEGKANVFHSMDRKYCMDWEEIYELDIENLHRDRK
ncbi:MAG: hypothetical protein AAF696_03745 [Bacteroidota bacterium]